MALLSRPNIYRLFGLPSVCLLSGQHLIGQATRIMAYSALGSLEKVSSFMENKTRILQMPKNWLPEKASGIRLVSRAKNWELPEKK